MEAMDTDRSSQLPELPNSTHGINRVIPKDMDSKSDFDHDHNGTFWCETEEECLPGYGNHEPSNATDVVVDVVSPQSSANHLASPREWAISRLSSCVPRQMSTNSSISTYNPSYIQPNLENGTGYGLPKKVSTQLMPGRIKGIEPYAAKWIVSCKGMVPAVKEKKSTSGRRRSSVVAKRRQSSAVHSALMLCYTFSIYKDGSVQVHNKNAFGWNGNAVVVFNSDHEGFEIHPVAKENSTEYEHILLNDDDSLRIEHYNTAQIGLGNMTVFKGIRT